MTSQWENLLQNEGEWEGTFARFSPRGEQLDEVPSLLILESFDDRQALRFSLQRFPEDRPPYDMKSEFRTLSRSMLVFADGAFSKGSMQWSPVSEFGGEFGLKTENERLRLVQLYNKERELTSITLIREKSRTSATPPPQRPTLTVDQLIGNWQGEAIVQYADFRPCDRFPTGMQIQREGEEYLSQTLAWGNNGKTLRSLAKISGSILDFEESEQKYQILLLPNGASSNCPRAIVPRRGFILELGWLVTPTRRMRLIRRYNEGGEWVNSTLVTEEKN